VTGPWIDRREFHPGAPRIDQLVHDRAGFHTGAVTITPQTAQPGDWCDAERLWDRFLTTGTRWPAFRMVREGTTLPRSRFTRRASVGSQRIEDLVEPNHVLELYGGGATVVLQALQFSDPEFAMLSTNLALDLNHPIQVNAYLSPRAARGLDIHFDFHDVVVAQLAGAKRWRVWQALPRSERPLKRGPVVAQPSANELGTPLVDRVLEAGGCLTVPRGFPHAAETVDAESTHLTIGVMALTWSRVLRDRIDQIASGTPLADRLSLDATDDAGWPADRALKVLADGLGEDDLRHAIAEDVWRRQPQTRIRPRRPPQLGASTRVRVTAGPLIWVDERMPTSRKPALALGDRRLRYPPACADFIAAILRSQDPFAATDLDSSLDLASRVVVLQRLAVEGVVEEVAVSA